MQKSNLYRVIYINDFGFVVYRHCFDTKKCGVIEGARAHKQAVFVDGLAANDYAKYRNLMIDENGTDALNVSSN